MDNALLKDLAAARAARRGEPTLAREPAAAPAPAPARATREIISIDSDDDATPAPAAQPAREGVIEIHSDSDDDAAAARRVTTDAIDLTRDSDDDEGPRKRQRTVAPQRQRALPAPRPPPPQRPRIQVIRNYGGVQGLVVAPRFLSEAAERRLFDSMGTRCPLPTGQVETGFGRSDLTGAPRGRYDRFSPDLWRCINGIRDHVYPELLLPDFALFWSYRQKRKRGGGLVSNGNAFNVHYDSKITAGRGTSAPRPHVFVARAGRRGTDPCEGAGAEGAVPRPGRRDDPTRRVNKSAKTPGPAAAALRVEPRRARAETPPAGGIVLVT